MTYAATLGRIASGAPTISGAIMLYSLNVIARLGFWKGTSVGRIG